MKQYFAKIRGGFILGMGLALAVNLVAQNGVTPAGQGPSQPNDVDWARLSAAQLAARLKTVNPEAVPADAWGGILKKIDWSNIPTNVQAYVIHEVDWSVIPTNVWTILIHPNPWPESTEKQLALAHSAELLRSSVNLDEIKLADTKLTNHPEIASTIERSSTAASANLGEIATLLTNPAMKTFIGDGYEAEMQSPKKDQGMIYVSFWSDKGPVRSFDRRSADGGHVIASARFYENGKLQNFTDDAGSVINFTEDGKLVF